MPNLTTVHPAPPPPPKLQAASQDAAIRDAAKQLEASFLTEMLKSAGLGKAAKDLAVAARAKISSAAF